MPRVVNLKRIEGRGVIASRQSVKAWLRSQLDEQAVFDSDIRREFGLSKGHVSRMLKDPVEGKTSRERGERPLRLKMAIEVAIMAEIDPDECGRRWIADELGLSPDDVVFAIVAE